MRWCSRQGQLAHNGRKGCLIEAERSVHVFQGALPSQPRLNPLDAFAGAILGDIEPVKAAIEDYERQVWAVIEDLKSELPRLLEVCHHVVAFIPMVATDIFIEVIGQIPQDKITVLMCTHALGEKNLLLAQAGLGRAFNLVTDECKGCAVMGMFCDEFLRTGKLPREIGAEATYDNPGRVGMPPGS